MNRHDNSLTASFLPDTQSNWLVSTLFGPVVGPAPAGPISHPEVEWDSTELNLSGDWCQPSSPTIPTTTASPIGWYLVDHQRHEWLAVSLSMSTDGESLLHNNPVFTRSLAPSVSTRRALNVGVSVHNNETNTASIVDTDDCGLAPLDSSPKGQPRVSQSSKTKYRGTTSSSATYLNDPEGFIPMYQGSSPTVPP